MAVDRSSLCLQYCPLSVRTQEVYKNYISHSSDHFFNIEDEIKDKPYYKELKRHAYVTMIKNPSYDESSEFGLERRRLKAQKFLDVMTSKEKQRLSLIHKPRASAKPVMV